VNNASNGNGNHPMGSNGRRIKAELRRIWENYGTKAFVPPDRKDMVAQVEAEVSRIEALSTEEWASFMTAVTLLFTADRSGKLLDMTAIASQAIQEIDQLREVVESARRQQATRGSGARSSYGYGE